MQFKRDFPQKGSGWQERIVWIWEEDDARPPDAERIEKAFLRITGSYQIISNLGAEHPFVEEFIDLQDTMYFLLKNGWVVCYSCMGSALGIVVKSTPSA